MQTGKITLQIRRIVKTEIIFVHSLISGSAPNLQDSLQRKKEIKKENPAPVAKILFYAVLQELYNFLEKLRFNIFYSPRFNLNTPKSPYASITLE